MIENEGVGIKRSEKKARIGLVEMPESWGMDMDEDKHEWGVD